MRYLLIAMCMFTLLACGQCLAGTVLWDISHGVYMDYLPRSYHSSFVADLVTAGFTVDSTGTGFLVDNPSDYDVIVISEASSYYTPYTSAEAEIVSQFVSNGGGLLILGDNPGCSNENLQAVASRFGLSLGVSDITPYDSYTTALGTHPIFDGISQIYMRAAGEIASTAGLAEIAWQEGTTNALVAAGTYGNGRVVALGDVNIFTNDHYGLVDNPQFAMNTFNYLVPEPATLLILGLGGLLIRKRK